MAPIFSGEEVSEPEQVLVEPVSEDDWELLERHPADVEQNLLNSIRIVYEQQVFPYWIAGQHLIKLRVVSKFDTPCARLHLGCEVVVTAKKRKTNLKPAKAKGERHPGMTTSRTAKLTTGPAGRRSNKHLCASLARS